jgi:hypothetical protein
MTEIQQVDHLGMPATRQDIRSLDRARLFDAAFLVLVTTVPALFYTRGLAFYFDDHYFLGLMANAHDHSVGGLFGALAGDDPKAQLRPVEYFLLATMYRLFGANPLPYHIVLAGLVPLCAVTLYVVLGRLGLPRFLALAIPVVFATAPHYSSAKLWPAAYDPVLTLVLFLWSLYASLRAAEASRRQRAGWLALAAITLLASAFMYELVLPLFALAALYHVVRARRHGGGWRTSALVIVAVLGLALAIKLVISLKVGTETSYRIGYEYGFLHQLGYLVSGTVKLNAITYGVALPYVIGWIVAHRLTWSAVGASAIVGVGSFLYLAHGTSALRGLDRLPSWRGRPMWQYLAAAGLGVVAAGYGVFVTTGSIYFTSAGIDNRVNVVAALGMALIAVALILRLLDFVPPARRHTAFALAVAGLAATGTLVMNTIASYWQEAGRRQADILAALRAALPPDPSGKTVILRGACAEVGPGVVFTTDYDLAGALQTLYRDPTIHAGVATGSVGVMSRRLVVSNPVYNYVETHSYRYGRQLLLYDWQRRKIHTASDAAAARRFLAGAPRLSCPPGRSFAWGVRVSRLMPID